MQEEYKPERKEKIQFEDENKAKNIRMEETIELEGNPGREAH